jgi:hypothetical protein
LLISVKATIFDTTQTRFGQTSMCVNRLAIFHAGSHQSSDWATSGVVRDEMQQAPQPRQQSTLIDFPQWRMVGRGMGRIIFRRGNADPEKQGRRGLGKKGDVVASHAFERAGLGDALPTISYATLRRSGVPIACQLTAEGF